MGPHVHDPRSGEIISAHIIIWHDVLKLVQQWYFAQCAALDAKAQKLPFSDELTGSLLHCVLTSKRVLVRVSEFGDRACTNRVLSPT